MPLDLSYVSKVLPPFSFPDALRDARQFDNRDISEGKILSSTLTCLLNCLRARSLHYWLYVKTTCVFVDLHVGSLALCSLIAMIIDRV